MGDGDRLVKFGHDEDLDIEISRCTGEGDAVEGATVSEDPLELGSVSTEHDVAFGDKPLIVDIVKTFGDKEKEWGAVEGLVLMVGHSTTGFAVVEGVKISRVVSGEAVIKVEIFSSEIKL